MHTLNCGCRQCGSARSSPAFEALAFEFESRFDAASAGEAARGRMGGRRAPPPRRPAPRPRGPVRPWPPRIYAPTLEPVWVWPGDDDDGAAAAPAPADAQDAFELLNFEAPNAQPLLRSGSRGTAVAELQRRLAAAGHSPGPIDGIFGSQTRSAVLAYQRARGLEVDGIVGPQTWGALLGAAGPKPGPTPGPTPGPSAPPASGLRGRAVQAALQEWERWGRGSIPESDPSMRPVLEAYWQAATGKPPPSTRWFEPPWSAVFISWVMRQAGAGNQFRYSSAHTDYVAAAKANRLAGNTNPFKAYRISEMAPRPGDLVCVDRSSDSPPVTYDNVDDGTFRPSHSDVVVAASAGKIEVVGGNVSNTASRKTISVDSSGKLRGAPYYAVLRVGD